MRLGRGTLGRLLAAACLWLCCLLPAMALGAENKVFVYLIYNRSSPTQSRFVSQLQKKFNELGFSALMKRKGVVWVESDYSSARATATYLRIGADEVIYFAILMADRSDHITREMYRAHVSVSGVSSDAAIATLADNHAHRFYFALADVMDNFGDANKWKRQLSLVNPRAEKKMAVRIKVDGKPFRMQPLAFRRQNIHVVMVPFSDSLWKRLGADGCGTTELHGHQSLWVKKGSHQVIFELGSSIADLKTYRVEGPERTFVLPTNTAFAYPEMADKVAYVPLRLVMRELNLQYDYELSDNTVTLVKKKAK